MTDEKNDKTTDDLKAEETAADTETTAAGAATAAADEAAQTADATDDAQEADEPQAVHFTIEYDDDDQAAPATDSGTEELEEAFETAPAAPADDLALDTTPKDDATDDSAAGDGDDSDHTASAIASSLDRGLADESASAQEAVFASYPLLALKNVTLSVKKTGQYLWENLSVRFDEGRSYGVLVPREDSERHAALVGLLTGLVRPTAGQVVTKTTDLDEIEPVQLRGHRIGTVLRQYALRDDLSAVQNIVNAMQASNRNFLKPMGTIAQELLKAVRFGEHDDETAKPAKGIDTLASRLGPLDWRRAAIARALATDPDMIVADEPTDDLAGDDVAEIADLLKRQAVTPDKKRAVIVVTADPDLAARFDQQVNLTR
ncbi:MAG: ATP-binding cassette domain-containing protein [Bifidobacterium sp.]|nr:ATP-binding cassette domain-containing protein [Bifidobacterium sp.]